MKRKHAFLNHILTKKATKQKRHLGNKVLVSPSDEKNMKKLVSS